MSEFTVIWAVALLSGCGAGEATSETTVPADADAGTEGEFSEAASVDGVEVAGPTILGVDGELQKEMRSLLAAFIEQRQIPGDAAENLAKAFDSAMQTVRRPADELGIEPDAAGNMESMA